jgi:hypothetical protein
MVFLVCQTSAQEKSLSYTIKRDGQSVGSMNIIQVKAGNTISYKLHSEVKTKFILTFTAKRIEEAIYNNGVLIYSSVYQNQNGKEKLSKQVRFDGNKYIVTDKGTKEQLSNTPIKYNMVCLYTNEPSQINLVFSDKFQKLLPIQKLGEHHYKISFPDGNFNEYYYSDGTCKRIEVNHSFYSAVMELH